VISLSETTYNAGWIAERNEQYCRIIARLLLANKKTESIVLLAEIKQVEKQKTPSSLKRG
jgi:hypothetical protein